MTEVPSLPLSGSQSVLIVDDVGIVRRAVFRMLAHAGYRLYDAASAKEALEVLETAVRPIDLALVDVLLPGMGGVELVQIIAERWPKTRVLYMSGFPAEALPRQGLAEPGVQVLKKPFTRDELLHRIWVMLGEEQQG